MIVGKELSSVLRCLPSHKCLPWQRLHVRFADGRDLRRDWPALQSAGTTVVADARLVHVGVVHHGHAPVVHVVVYHLRPHVVHVAVVVEVVAIPVTALVPDADKAEAVVHASVIAHVPSPVPAVPAVAVAIRPPLPGRPQGADKRRGYPVAGHIVIARVRVIPVPWRPYVVRAGSGWLLISGQWRRRLERLGRVWVQ